MKIEQALTEWIKHVKAQKLSKESEGFVIGHPWMFKESQQFFDKITDHKKATQ